MPKPFPKPRTPHPQPFPHPPSPSLSRKELRGSTRGPAFQLRGPPGAGGGVARPSPRCHSPVVGRGEDGDALAVVGHLVALGLDLVAADDVVEAVALQEALGDVGPELAAHPPLADRAPVLEMRGGGVTVTASPPPPGVILGGPGPRGCRAGINSPAAAGPTTAGRTWDLHGRCRVRDPPQTPQRVGGGHTGDTSEVVGGCLWGAPP